jgi:hypothetical protein
MKIDVGDTLAYIGYGKSSFYRVVGCTPGTTDKGQILDVQAFSNRKSYLSISSEVCKIKPIAYLQPRKPGWYLL